MLQGFAGLSAAGMEPGYDKVNQDFIYIQPLNTGDAASSQSYMFAVLDGHGVEGARAARLVPWRLPTPRPYTFPICSAASC